MLPFYVLGLMCMRCALSLSFTPLEDGCFPVCNASYLDMVWNVYNTSRATWFGELVEFEQRVITISAHDEIKEGQYVSMRAGLIRDASQNGDVGPKPLGPLMLHVISGRYAICRIQFGRI